MQQLKDYSVWGWERLFDEKGHFLATTDWEFYTQYLQFVLERLGSVSDRGTAGY